MDIFAEDKKEFLIKIEEIEKEKVQAEKRVIELDKLLAEEKAENEKCRAQAQRDRFLDLVWSLIVKKFLDIPYVCYDKLRKADSKSVDVIGLQFFVWFFLRSLE